MNFFGDLTKTIGWDYGVIKETEFESFPIKSWNLLEIQLDSLHVNSSAFPVDDFEEIYLLKAQE